MRDCNSTEIENVYLCAPWLALPPVTPKVRPYIANEAVLIRAPRIYTTHCPLFSGAPRPRDVPVQGIVGSDNKTPFSLASCSKVTGMNEPIPQTTNTSAAHAYEYQPISSFREVGRTSWPGNKGSGR
jgi:hypothetical protein